MIAHVALPTYVMIIINRTPIIQFTFQEFFHKTNILLFMNVMSTGYLPSSEFDQSHLYSKKYDIENGDETQNEYKKINKVKHTIKKHKSYKIYF